MKILHPVECVILEPVSAEAVFTIESRGKDEMYERET